MFLFGKILYIMNINIERVTYCYSLNKKQWNALLKVDYLDVVFPSLIKLGAISIEYNGHFGRNIYVEMRSPESCLPIKEAILALAGKV